MLTLPQFLMDLTRKLRTVRDKVSSNPFAAMTGMGGGGGGGGGEDGGKDFDQLLDFEA